MLASVSFCKDGVKFRKVGKLFIYNDLFENSPDYDGFVTA